MDSIQRNEGAVQLAAQILATQQEIKARLALIESGVIALITEIASLRDTIRLTRNVLAAAQWTLERSGGVTVSRCELCGATREQGHDEGCTYRDALELLEAAL